MARKKAAAGKGAKGTGEFSNPLGLSPAQLQALSIEFAPLTGIAPTVVPRVLKYLVDGEDVAVLTELSNLKQGPGLLGLSFAEFGTRNWDQEGKLQLRRQEMLAAQPRFPHAVLRRLGEVYHAMPHSYSHGPSAFPDWLYDLLVESQVGHREAGVIWPLAEFEGFLQEHGLTPTLVAIHAVENGIGSYPIIFAGAFGDFAEYLQRHASVVETTLKNAKPAFRGRMYDHLKDLKWNPMPSIELVADDCCQSTKSLRESALAVIQHHAKQARPHLERLLAEGNTGTRQEAVQALWRLYGTDAAAALRKQRKVEKNERVNQAIDTLLLMADSDSGPASAQTAEGSSQMPDLPPLVVETGIVPLSEAARSGLREHFEKDHQTRLQGYQREQERWKSPDRPKGMSQPVKPKAVTAAELDLLFKFVEGSTADAKWPYNHYALRALGDWFAPPDFKLVHVLRLMVAFRQAQVDEGQFWTRQTALLEQYRTRCQPPFGLREMDAVVASLANGQRGLVLDDYLRNNSHWYRYLDWEPPAIWPAFAEDPGRLKTSLEPAQQNRNQRDNAIKVMSYFPQLPAEFVPVLWQLAVTAPKAERPLVRQALQTVPDKPRKVCLILKDKKPETRASAAEWLGQLGDPVAIDPLKAAYQAESQEVVKGAFLAALDKLGADVSEFIDRKKLLKVAEAGLQKKKLPGLDWFPLDALPPLHWADTGKKVDPQIVRWWLVEAVQQKVPVAGPLLRRYVGLCRPEGAAKLAEFILQSWLSHDTQTLSHDEALAKAKKYANKYYSAEELLKQYLGEFTGSAIGEKGMLALVAAAGTPNCVKLATQYIRKYFGYRLAQCKCLIDVLAELDDPGALQTLLAISTRFRTKALRDQATERVQQIADRNGWTIDELADRTIPDAGFERPVNDQGEPVGHVAQLLLDFGPRKFTVRLNDNLEPTIENAEGKVIKSLPVAAKTDDAELAKEASKQFSEAKKSIKEVVARQRERLYEALCTQRSWVFSDWQRYLAMHPIVGRLCTRVVWVVNEAGEKGKLLGSFRPLEDGTLTSAKDDAVEFPPTAMVRVAHPCNLPAAEGKLWPQHLADYDITPLFTQFGRDPFVLDPEMKNTTEIKTFEGHMLNTFKMRGRATKLGYVRGEAEDAGWFYSYRKPFPSLGLHAVIHFTGNYLPEEDRPCALTTLSFTRVQSDRESFAAYAPPLPLGSLPPVLLSECHGDLRQLAAEGTGFDPNWESKSSY